MNKYDNSPEDRKKELPKTYYQEKNNNSNTKVNVDWGKKNDSTVGKLGEKDVEGWSSLFSASFCDGIVDTIVLAE